MEYSLDRKISVIYLRNRLLTGTREKLKNYYSYEENFIEFLDAMLIELNTEPEYFLLHDKIINNVEDIIQSFRFEYKDAATINKVNEIIV